MTPHEPDHAAALAAIGLGFELSLEEQADVDGAELTALRDAAAMLAYAPPPVVPSPAAWRRLMMATAPTRARRRRPTIGLALGGAGVLAAAAALIVAVRTVDDRDRWRRMARAADRAAVLAGEEVRSARAQVEQLDERLRGADLALAPVRAPELEVATFHGDGAGRARVLLDPGSRRWVVVAFELPAIDDKDYQLWLVPDGGAPISAGVLRRRADGVLEITGTVPPAVAGFRPAISLEPRGGSPAPTSIQMVGEPL